MDMSNPPVDDTGTEVPISFRVPSYLLGADNHTIGKNKGASWFDPSTWGQAAENIGQFAAVSVLSGANSFYNTGAAIGRLLGAETEANDTGKWITGLDQDLGKYYKANEQSADLAGFLITSIVPGLGGIKVLNVGQAALKRAAATGIIGENLSRATGLLVPKTALYIEQSAKEITQGMNMFSAINTAGVKALAAGVQQNVLEGVAFEIAVQATMAKSPILDGQDTGDIVKNIALGGALGGVVGGAFSGAVTYGTIKRAAVKEQGFLTKAFGRDKTVWEPGTPASAKVIMLQDELDTTIANGIGIKEGPENVIASQKLLEDKVRRIQLEMRTAVNELATDPKVIGNMYADAIHGSGVVNTLDNLLHAEHVSRIGEVTAIDRELIAAAKEQSLGESNLGRRYVRLTGEGAGQVVEEYPIVHNLADKVDVRPGQSLQDAVLAEVKSYKQKVGDGFSMLSKGIRTSRSAHLEVEARYIAMMQLKELPEDLTIHFTDLPVLQRALKDGRTTAIRLVDDSGAIRQEGFASVKDLQDYIIATKQELADKMIISAYKRGTALDPHTTESIAKILDVRLGRLEQDGIGDPIKDFFARDSATEAYHANLVKKGLRRADSTPERTDFLPSFAKVSYRVPPDIDLSGHVMNGLAYLKAQQKVLHEQADNVVAKNVGDLFDLIPSITERDLNTANLYGAGARIAAFANAAYDTLASKMQLSGSLTDTLVRKFQKQTSDLFETTLAPLMRKPEAAIEHATINQKVTRSAKLWVTDSAEVFGSGRQVLIERGAYNKALAAIGQAEKDGKPLTSRGIDDLLDDIAGSSGDLNIIDVVHKETWDQIKAEISLSSQRTKTFGEINSVRGQASRKDPEVYRPIRPNLKEYQHFAFVKDNRVTGSGHTTMLHAASPEKLDELVNTVRAKSPEYQIVTKGMSDDWFKAHGEYEYSRSLNENYLDANLANRGIFSEFYTKTDPQKIVNDILQQHLREDRTMATELMRLKNEAAFSWLEDASKRFSDISGSTFTGTSLSRLEREGKNPYLDYIKTGLNVSKISEYPLLYNFNRTLDQAVSRGVAKVRDLWAAAKDPVDLESINKVLAEQGMNTAYSSAAEVLLANHTAPRGELTKFVRRANSILSTLTLGLDPINALNNALGANLLRTTELTQITDAIKAGNSEIAGQLATLTKVRVPGTDDLVLAPSKLMAKAMRAFTHEPKDSEIMQYLKDLGVLRGPTEQFRSILDDFTLQGTETASDLNSRISRAFAKAKALRETGQKYSGNELSEEFNRFVSGYSMMQLTDLAEKAGLMTHQEAGVYISTFVNRVEGNIIASQRPLVFQGPIGQAIGLFQSYQFNLMQQMFRYVSEGTKKDAAMLLGLQGTFYGLAGLPAFQFINQHVIGNLSGNTNHIDAYDAVLGIAGKEAGEFVLYGVPSNILQWNLYTRGDINPRQVTVLPTSIADIPFVGAYAKFFGSVKESVTKIAGGAPVWESLLQGIEHNGLSRPLSGIAQTLQATGPDGLVYSTSNQGTILFSNDLFSWATATRMAGARPLDEAVVNDAVYRVQSYRQANSDKMTKLAETVKAAVISGNQPSDDAISAFAAKYAEAGGKQVQFNQWFMKQYKNANTPESIRISQQLSNPLGQKVQLLMD